MIKSFYDDSGLADDKDFAEGLQSQVLTKNYKLSGVPLKYQNGTVFTDTSDAHSLIFGNTGSKKTRNFCIPSVYTIGMAGESMVISDPKGEIYRNTSGFLKKKGYAIKVFKQEHPLYPCSSKQTAADVGVRRFRRNYQIQL